jgi:hypothetical protein
MSKFCYRRKWKEGMDEITQSLELQAQRWHPPHALTFYLGERGHIQLQKLLGKTASGSAFMCPGNSRKDVGVGSGGLSAHFDVGNKRFLFLNHH